MRVCLCSQTRSLRAYVLRPDLRPAKKETLLSTNAILLNPKRQSELVESGLDELRVSCDSSTPETYAKIRGVNVLPKVLKNVGEMIGTRRRLNADLVVNLGILSGLEAPPLFPGSCVDRIEVRIPAPGIDQAVGDKRRFKQERERMSKQSAGLRAW